MSFFFRLKTELMFSYFKWLVQATESIKKEAQVKNDPL